MKNLSKILLALCMLSNFANDSFASVPGTLDTTFNAGGIEPGTVSTTIGSFTGFSLGQSVAIQPDGKIVVAGYVDVGGGVTNFAVARFNTDGTLDATFNATGPLPGTVSTPIENFTGSSQGLSVALQQDGKIVVSGNVNIGGGVTNFAVARFNTNGTLDTTFNAAGPRPGTVSTPIDNFTGSSSGQSVAIQQDGKIVVAGYVDTGGFITNIALARFNTNGTLDTTFNAGGFRPGTEAKTVTGSTSSDGMSVALQQDGKIVVAGDATVGGLSEVAVARFNTDGSFDTTFNATGTLTTTIDSLPNAFGRAVGIQQDGKIVVGGFVFDAGLLQFAVARFLTNGAPDSTLNAEGTTQPGTEIITISSALFAEDLSVAIAMQNEKIVLGGVAAFGPGDFKFAVARLLTNGALDTTFNPAGTQPGVALTTIDNNPAIGVSVAIQQDGKIVLAGYELVNDTDKFAVARFIGDTPTPPIPSTNNACALRLIEKYGPRLSA